VIYQIDGHCRRLLWVGRRRTKATLRRGLKVLGPAVVSGLRYVCSDMWQPYLRVMAKEAGQALHILDRFHIVQHLNKAVDEIRRAESTRLRGKPIAAKLQENALETSAAGQPGEPPGADQAGRTLAEQAGHRPGLGSQGVLPIFLAHQIRPLGGNVLDYWTGRAMRTRLEPMKKVARMLRKHRPLLLNWFKARGEVSSGAVEGLNNKIRVVTRRSYGFRTYPAMELALYHNLGRLPEPEATHSFC